MATRYAVVELESTESTQNVARDRATSAGPVLVVATHQTAGRGRLGRSWVQADRAMYSSFAFEPGGPVGDQGLIPLVAGLAVRSAIKDLTGIDVELRWPNDLMLGEAKVGGIITESSGGVVVVGCGVNLEWATPMEGAVALGTAATGGVSSVDLARTWADRFLSRIDRNSNAGGLDEYRAVCGTIGRHVSYAGGSGLAVGIADDGSLLIETPAGTVSVRSGEVRLHDAATLPKNHRRD